LGNHLTSKNAKRARGESPGKGLTTENTENTELKPGGKINYKESKEGKGGAV